MSRVYGLSPYGRSELVAETGFPDKTISYLLSANWRDSFFLEETYSTSISNSDSGAETRSGLRSLPTRTIRFTISGLSSVDCHRAITNLLQHTGKKVIFPLLSDVGRITSDSSGSTVNPM